jgi:Tfp pilus assembly protein PilV
MRQGSDVRSQKLQFCSSPQWPSLARSRPPWAGFTVAELLISVAVLVLLVLFVAQLLTSAMTVTNSGNKRMDAESQARELLDRMAIDFAQMVKRADVDYYVKSSAAAPLRNVLQPGNDNIAFYSTVPGYYPSSGSQSPVSLVSYRVNRQNKLERMGKGLVWNAVSSSDTPVVFIPIPLASPLPSPLPSPVLNPAPTPAWPTIMDLTASPTPEPSVEVIGPQVFRFEYYYLLRSGVLSDTPWDTNAGHNSIAGMQDVAAVIVDIAAIDSKSKVMLTDTDITNLVAQLGDYSSGMIIGQLSAQWRNTVNTIANLPRPALSGIRLYERCFYLSPPTLLTP